MGTGMHVMQLCELSIYINFCVIIIQITVVFRFFTVEIIYTREDNYTKV